MPIDRAAAARAIDDFLRAIGRDRAADANLAETPRLVADAFIDELTVGHSIDVRRLLRDGSAELTTIERQPIVVLRDLAITTMCPHHLLPARGTATIAYVPKKRLAGIGVLAEATAALARRLVLQEALTKDIVRVLIDDLEADAAACRVSLVHGCMAARGERRETPVVTFFEDGFDAAMSTFVFGSIA